MFELFECAIDFSNFAIYMNYVNFPFRLFVKVNAHGFIQLLL